MAASIKGVLPSTSGLFTFKQMAAERVSSRVARCTCAQEKPTKVRDAASRRLPDSQAEKMSSDTRNYLISSNVCKVLLSSDFSYFFRVDL